MGMRSEDFMRRFSRAHVTLIASRAHALADPTRVRMIESLSRGDQAVGQLASALKMQQSTASKHLQVLFRAGLVERRREASAVIYSIATRELIEWCRYLGYRQLGSAAIPPIASIRMNSSRSLSANRAARRSGSKY
jgi:DNA-binding transcriptional ArsR family regulator